jgi:hypothetical protein
LRLRAACGTAETLAPDRSERDAAAGADEFFFRLLAVAWAFAALFHTEFHLLYWKASVAGARLTGALVVVAALITCWRPTVRHVAALALTELLDVWVMLPDVPNHWLLSALVNVGWLLGCVRARTPASLVARVRAPLMLSVVLFYLWTGVWKLNADFVRPDVSCAVVSWDRVLGTFRWLPDTDGVRRGIIAGTLLMELVGPVLLLLPATRGIAVVGFVAFHVLLGLDARMVYLNFSSVMFALLLLFLPDPAVARLARLVPERAFRWARAAGVAYVAFALVAVAAGPVSPAFLFARWLLWLGYALGMLAVVVLGVVGAPRARRWLPAGARGGLAWIVPVLVLVNGFAPVLGVKTRTGWQMYSNVRLEPHASNHFIFRRSLDVLGAMDDPVTVVATDDPRLRDVAGTRLALPWIEFRRRVAAHPAATTTWERRGERHTTTGTNDPLLSAPLPVLVRKLTTFRPLGPDAGARCDW